MRAFDAWQRREAAARIERQEDAHIAALHANSNWDSDKVDRHEHIDKLREYYSALRKRVLGDEVNVEKEVPNEHQDAFMRAGQRALASVLPPEMPGEQSIRKFDGG